MRFEDVAGHTELKQKFVETVMNDRVSHSQLFHGPEGNGGLPLAIAYAQYLLCNNPTSTDSCGICTSCRQVKSFNYPDLHYVFPVASTTKSGSKPVSANFINEWRELVQKEQYFGLYRWLESVGVENKQAQISVNESADMMRKLQLKSYSGKHKIVIIWMPERMNASASNKLLKLLEEPPQKTLFLLVSEDADSLLKTITSRCQKTRIPKYSQQTTHNFLVENEKVETGPAGIIAQLVDGNLAQAKRLAQGAAIYEDYAQLFSHWVRTCFKADVKQIIDWAESCGKFEREKVRDFLLFCSNTFRDSFNINYGYAEKHSVFDSINFELSKFSPFIHLRNTSKILEELDSATYDISRNANAKLVLTDLSLNLARLLRVSA